MVRPRSCAHRIRSHVTTTPARTFTIFLCSGGEPKNEPQEEFNFQVIPIENSLKDQADKADARKTLTIEVSSEFQDYIDMNPDFQDFRTESENSR